MNKNVERCELAPGLSISRVLTGLWQIADMERNGKALNPQATAALMAPYAEAGFTTFDMADHYGSAEIIAGCFRQMRAPDQPVQLLTKWVPTPGPVTRDDVRAVVQRALDRLQTDAIDLLQFHAWNYADPRWLDCLFWLQELKEQGLIRHLGLTNFDTAHLRIVVHSGIDVVSNQVCFSLIDQRPQQRMTELCLQHGIKLLCYGTVAGGFLSERWLGKPEPDLNALGTWSQMKYKRFIDAAGGWQKFQHLLSVVEGIARHCKVSISNIACRYILEQPAVGGVIIGARLGERQHLDENLRLFQFTLDETSRARIRAAMAQLHSIPGDCGDEYRKPPFLTASGDLRHHLNSMSPPYAAQTAANGRSKILSGTVWEDLAGFCRAVRIGNRICISGTTATHGSRAIGGADAAAQLHFVIDKIEGALHSLGGQMQDVMRTRLYVRHLADWEAVARAHGERFRDIQPANTLVQAGLVGEEYLVEMEAEAVVNGAD
jgi:aryl-alcohol dehydrogenase-like predicted oxidoreductase/enamine deaminase RidA (YjgF/YER057c/UK114 family)